MTFATGFPVVFSVERTITVLGSGVLALFGAGIAIAAGRAQERYKRKDRQRELAGALLVECSRIRRQLGAPRDKMMEITAYGLTMAPPEIHRWMQQLIPASAVIDPRIVEQFIQLDTQLANFQVAVPLWRAARSTAESTQADFERAERARDLALMSGLPMPLVQPGGDAQHRREMNERRDFLETECVDARERAIEHLDRLDALLTPHSGKCG
jgi:hypothetical protein